MHHWISRTPYIMTHKQVLKKLPLVNNNIIFSFDDDYKVVGGEGRGGCVLFFLCWNKCWRSFPLSITILFFSFHDDFKVVVGGGGLASLLLVFCLERLKNKKVDRYLFGSWSIWPCVCLFITIGIKYGTSISETPGEQKFYKLEVKMLGNKDL